jgi:hypothetical protein
MPPRWCGAASISSTRSALIPAIGLPPQRDRTARLQGALTAVLRDALPGNRKWEADALSQFARLMCDIRNYGVHPGR